MSSPPVPLTEIKMCFYVELFLRECVVYNSLKLNESSNETLVCDFLRKHIFKTIIEQATEVESEYPEGSHEKRHARIIRLAVTLLSRNVRQVNAGDDMVNVHMNFYTPISHGKPMANDENLRRWVIARIFTPMMHISESFAESNKVHGEFYRQVAREMERMIKGDQFANFTLSTVYK